MKIIPTLLLLVSGILFLTSGFAKQALGAPHNPYLVEFDLGSAQLTKKSRDILDVLATTWVKYGDYKLLVECHSDRMGAEQYNLALSKRRCAAVRDFLVKAGVNPGMIVLWPRGEDGMRVPTPDGVKEHENRVTIIGGCREFDDWPGFCGLPGHGSPGYGGDSGKIWVE